MRKFTIDNFAQLKEAKQLFKEIRRKGNALQSMLFETQEKPTARLIYFFPADVTKKPAKDSNLIELKFGKGDKLFTEFLSFLIGKAARIWVEDTKESIK